MAKKRKLLFDPVKSLTKLLVEYHVRAPGRSSNKQTYYSFLNLDAKSRERGIAQLRKQALKESEKIKFAGIYDNLTGSKIEYLIVNGRVL